jgi:hypothetical protein
MKKKVLLSIIVLSCLFSVGAETHISGDIRTATLDATGNPYIIDQDIVVPVGKHLTIKEGCVLLFKGFTGINVFGQLTVSGTTKQAVIFTSINDGDFNTKSEQLPNPFDWNGILIARESSGSSLQNFQLRYSVYGVKSQNPNVTIQSGIFRQNGQFHFTINDKIQYVQDNISYSYKGTAGGTDASPNAVKESESGSAASAASSEAKQPASNSKLAWRYASLGVGVVGIAVGTICLVQWIPVNKDLRLSDPEFAKKYPVNTKTKYDSVVKASNGLGAGTWIGYGLGILGLTGFTLTFVF